MQLRLLLVALLGPLTLLSFPYFTLQSFLVVFGEEVHHLGEVEVQDCAEHNDSKPSERAHVDVGVRLRLVDCLGDGSADDHAVYDQPKEPESHEADASVDHKPLLVDPGPYSEDPSDDIGDEDDVEDVNELRTCLVRVLAAAAPLLDVLIWPSFESSHQLFQSFLVLYKDSVFDRLDAVAFVA